MISERRAEDRTADFLAFAFVIVILLFAASGPLNELVRWLIKVTSAGFDELSRRDQRLLLKNHWLGSAHGGLERALLRPTGLILGLPILFSFAISFLTLPYRWRWVSWARSPFCCGLPNSSPWMAAPYRQPQRLISSCSRWPSP